MADIALHTSEKTPDAVAFKERLNTALYSPVFEAIITVLIVANAFTLAVLSYLTASDTPPQSWIILFVAIDAAIVGTFILELSLKLYAGGMGFFRSGWNVFDLVVVSVGVLGTAYPLTVIRSLRVLRTLRLIQRVPSMRVVVESFIRAIPGIGSVLMVILLMVFVYALVGNQLFGDIAPDLFGTLHGSAFTMFTVLTLEGWPDVARSVMANVPGSGLYFISFVMINSFAILNLMIAVIINAMEKEYNDHAEEEREDILDELKALRIDIAELKRN